MVARLPVPRACLPGLALPQAFLRASQAFRLLECDLPAAEPELQQRVDAAGRPGAYSWQKILCALRRLGDGSSYNSLDDQARMSFESMRQSFRAFVRAVRKCYATEYLHRPPTLGELRALEHAYAQKLFPGCIGALDCMHLRWKNCPKAWKGQYGCAGIRA